MGNSKEQFLAMSKTMYKKYILLAIIVLSANFTFGQAPGFMGKRLLIGAEAPMIVSFPGISLFQLGAEDNYQYVRTDEAGETYLETVEAGGVKFNIKPSIYVEYVLNRKSSLQLMARMFNSKQDVTGYLLEDGNSTYQYYPTDQVKTQSISIGLKYKKFKDSGINPVGKYFSVGLEYSTMKFLIDDILFLSGLPDDPGQPLNSKSSTLIPTFGLGTSQPLSSSLLLNFGVEFGLPLTMILTKKDESVMSDTWADRNAIGTYRSHYLFNITIGLAFLP